MGLKERLSEAKKTILDLFFPQFCLGCHQEGELLCPDCRRRLVVRPKKICPVCKLADQPRNCLGSDLNSLWALSHYKEYLVADLVQKIKYEFAIGLVGDCWQEYLAKFWELAQEGINKNTVIIPVPLHKTRFLQRGFNQSELIAKELAEISGLAVNAGLLKRHIYNEPQVGLSASRRKENIKGIFSLDWRKLSDSWGREIILVDDVYTTGSTLSECAKTLKSAGFKKVSGLVLAVD